MSTTSTAVPAETAPTVDPECRGPAPRPWPVRPSAIRRAATVRRRVNLVTDALAVADLLLGLSYSQRSLGRREQEDRP